MRIHLDDKRKISEIQEAFNQAFPYLKIEFFKKPHGAGATSPISEMLSADTTIGQWRTVHNEGDLEVKGTMKVQELESAFQAKYGLSVQVFRKSGEVWLETSYTDGWTLNEQNEQGEFMETEVGDKPTA
jgi:hypothetical protein